MLFFNITDISILKRVSLCFFLSGLSLSFFTLADQDKQEKEVHSDVILQIKKDLIEDYVFLNKAKDINGHLETLVKSGFFNDSLTPEEFAKLLTKEL